VNWGDDNIDTVDPANSPAPIKHEYSRDENDYTVTVTVIDQHGSEASTEFMVSVINAPPVIEYLDYTKISECNPKINLKGGFTDCNAWDTHKAVIDWGDGTIEPGEVTESDSSGTVIGSHLYDKKGEYNITVTVTDGDAEVSESLTVIIKGSQLLEASYDASKTILTLVFDEPIISEQSNLSLLYIEVNNSGEKNFGLSEKQGLNIQPKPGYPNIVTIDLARAHNFVMNLILGIISGNEFDVILDRGAFTGPDDGKNFPADISLEIVADGFILGMAGDVDGDGEITRHDAELILQASVKTPEVLPIYEAASEVNDLMASYGQEYDIMEHIADTDQDGRISSFDATTILWQISNISAAPALSSGTKECRIGVVDYQDDKLSISVDLDNTVGVYSADMIITYDPHLSNIANAIATNNWLMEKAIEPGVLKISMARIPEVMIEDSLVKLDLHLNSLDAIDRLKVAKIELNGGRTSTNISNLPKAFALKQNYPNPFNPETWIPYQISRPANISVTIYDLSGNVVKKLDLGLRMPGNYLDKSRAAYWDGTNEAGESVSSGIYFYQLQADQNSSVRKMTILR